MIRHCTRGPWGFSTTFDHQTGVRTISAYRSHPSKKVRAVCPYVVQYGEADGMEVASHDEATRIGLERGYLQPYGRNTTGFKQSRAARKRGYVCSDVFYNMRKGR